LELAVDTDIAHTPDPDVAPVAPVAPALGALVAPGPAAPIVELVDPVAPYVPDPLDLWDVGSGTVVLIFVMIMIDVATLILFIYVAFRLFKEGEFKHVSVMFFILLIILKQIANTVFKMHLTFELVYRHLHPTYVKPDDKFYGLYGTTVVLFMICVAVNINILFDHYIAIKEATEYRSSPNDYTTTRRFMMWGTFLLIMFMMFSGISVIRASVVPDVTANLLGKFYGIAGFTFLVLSITFFVVAILAILQMKHSFPKVYEP